MMNLSQTKLVGLTMELDLKTREYKELCDKLNKIKEHPIDANDKRLHSIKELFQKNYDDIVKINAQIKELKESEPLEEKQKLEQYNIKNIFNEKKDLSKIGKKENKNIQVIQNKKNAFESFLEAIKNFFSK